MPNPPSRHHEPVFIERVAHVGHKRRLGGDYATANSFDKIFTILPQHRRAVVIVDNQITFGLPRRGRIPKSGERIYLSHQFIGGSLVTIWGFADDIERVKAEPTTMAPTQQDWDTKVDGNRRLLPHILEVIESFSDVELRIFYELSPNGDALWQAFTNACDAKDKRLTFVEYAVAVMQEGVTQLRGPKSCLLGKHRGGTFMKVAHEIGIDRDLHAMISVYIEDPSALTTVLPKMCRGCLEITCPHFLTFANAHRR